MRRRTRVSAWAALAAACLVLTGCGVAMPHSGPVHETTLAGSDRDELPPNIDPPRPTKGASREEIVAGFLDAMTATPAVRTSVAREYLTKEASDSWQPSGMLIYREPLSPSGNNPIEQQFIDAYRTDARGAWLGPATAAQATVEFPMDLEDGEWRISQPPANLLVPQTWFAARFRQVSLYFFDPSNTLLIPEPVFVPRGPQFASALVNALLAGPSHELSGMEQSYLPTDLRSLVSVPVSAGGVAQVDLTSDTADADMPSGQQSEMLVSQLAWTLRQDPTIAKFRVTIDDRPLRLPGESEFSVEHGHQYAPYVGGSSTQLFGLQDGLMVGGSPQNIAPVTGPFGQPGFSLREVSTDVLGQQAAGVSTDGSSLWLAPVKDSGDPPVELTSSGEDLLRPAWDFSGRLWEVDRRSSGAVVHYLHKDRAGGSHLVSLDVPGISGADVKHFLVSRDGSRLIAVIRDSAEQDSIVVSRILTTGDGQVVQALAADNITDPLNPEGQIRDITWSSPTSLAVLRPVSRHLFQVGSASVDGASGFDPFPVPVDGNVVGLAGTPVPDEKIYAFQAADTGTPAALVDLAGPQSNSMKVDSRVTSLSYAG
jgi:hypothetical protein